MSTSLQRIIHLYANECFFLCILLLTYCNPPNYFTRDLNYISKCLFNSNFTFHQGSESWPTVFCTQIFIIFSLSCRDWMTTDTHSQCRVQMECHFHTLRPLGRPAVSSGRKLKTPPSSSCPQKSLSFSASLSKKQFCSKSVLCKWYYTDHKDRRCVLGVITVTPHTGSSSPGRLISTAILCLHCTASPRLCLALWSANSLTNPLLHSLIHNAFSVTHIGFNVALGANVAECRKVRTITAYLRWRPVLKLRKEKKWDGGKEREG